MKLTIHNNEISFIKRKILGSRPSFSWLIWGDKGVGKATTIKLLADELLGSNINPHPDLLLISLEGDEKTIPIDRVKTIKDFLSLKPAIADKKIILIDSIDDISYVASNSLLKILEEPTPDTYIFIISHNINNVIETIRSRCTEVMFKTPSFEECKKVLTEIGINNKDIIKIIAIADANIGKVIEFADNNVLDDYEKLLKCIVSSSDPSINDIKTFDKNIVYLHDLIIRLISLVQKYQLGIECILIEEEDAVVQTIAKKKNAMIIMEIWQKFLENHKNQYIYNLDQKTSLYLNILELR